MTTLKGLHWRNVNPLAPGAFEIADGFDSFVVMSNMGPELPTVIHAAFPSAQIIARLYWPAGDLPSVGQATSDAYSYIHQTPGHAFIIGNEPDLENTNMTPEQFSEWFIEVRGRLREVYPWDTFGFPMPSVRGVPSWEYAVRCAAGIAQADFIAEHCYWINDEGYYSPYWGGRYHLCHSTWPGKPIHITEYGNADPNEDTAIKAIEYMRFMRELPDYVSSAHVFIMAGATDWDRAGFGVTKLMAGLMRQGIGQGPSGSTSENDPTASHDGTEGEIMTKDQLWQQLTEPYDTYPALAKPIIARGGVCVGTETIIAGYAFQLGLLAAPSSGQPFRVISYAKVGDWGNVRLALKPEELPVLSEAGYSA